jgi:CheY-like chemotaxis protein
MRTLGTGLTPAPPSLQKEDIHLVLLDLLMPEMDGFEVLKRIRETIPADCGLAARYCPER